MELHVSRAARDLYALSGFPFSPGGSLLFDEFRAARLLAEKINEVKRRAGPASGCVRAGQLNAIGLINEIFHFLIGLYRESRRPAVFQEAIVHLSGVLGGQRLDRAFNRLVEEFPPPAVFRLETTPEEFIESESGGVPHRQIELEEMLVLWLANMNPATRPFLDLFDDEPLEQQAAYGEIVSELREFFATRPFFGPDEQNLVDMLRSPALASPDSLAGQLDYIWRRWGYLLGKYKYIFRLLSSLDLIREEENLKLPGPGPPAVYDYSGLESEREAYSADRDWMPRLVLIAKNCHVWLDQLSRKHRREIRRLDQIPDEELELLARWGISGLWLIGLWQRSAASRKIKQMRGDPDADASAYSLFDYVIADDLGGEQAHRDLRERAWRHGLRLASDMVPNHMGIDSLWLIEQPDRFLSLEHSPFPSYSFTGPDLSWDERVGIFLEDHYFNNSDAAVVFRRVDRRTGSVRYVYHGNDGTSTPWNDTAQLNYLNPELREAVIQTILRVARQFPVIRFDAAMTLAKKHYQRLWFPEPGTGGTIPSRAEHAMTREQFDALMPEEFWRQVVDRVALEAPDTLLLAEAFWMMEGYFVRTLGMHRVYNSAFMNMLRDEENAKYRSVIKNTLEFDPEILKRYVNFMNNPDERTAIDQFGKEDKYFGICTLMATLPGLPMFGHGQIEGFAERYGMEFRRARWDEQPDPRLVARHEKEIAPLLHRRHLFAEAKDYLLYDFYTQEGRVNEDVFAYSNRCGGERALVLYHNRFASARGWIRTSAAFMAKAGGNGERTLAQRTLAQRSLGEGLGLTADEGCYAVFRDHLSGLEYIRSSKELFDRGLYVELDAYRCQVFLDFREVREGAGRPYARLASHLGGRGSPSIEEALAEVVLKVVQQPFAELVNASLFRRLIQSRPAGAAVDAKLLEEVERKTDTLLREIKEFLGAPAATDPAVTARMVRLKLEAILRLDRLGERFPWPRSKRYRSAAALLSQKPWDGAAGGGLLGWLFVHALGKPFEQEKPEQQSLRWMQEWRLSGILEEAMRGLGLDGPAVERAVDAILVLTAHQRWFAAPGPRSTSAREVLRSLLSDEQGRRFLKVNLYQDVLWFNKEAFDELLWWMLAVAAVDASWDPYRPAGEVPRLVAASHEVIETLQLAGQRSGYQVEKLLEDLSRPVTRTRKRPSPVS